MRLAQILLCLESVAKNCTKLSPECHGEIDDHRRMLMQDYQLSPELLSDCGDDINRFCGNDLEKIQGGGGEIIHCLMQHAQVKRRKDARVTAQCLRSIETLIKLYAHCRDDAIKHCNAKHVWDDVTDAQMDPERGPLILPCLHRMAYSDDPQQTLTQNCYKEVKRVMRLRAISVDLIPEVEDACLDDLSKFCTERTERGAEMECLQNNLEKLGINCQVCCVWGATSALLTKFIFPKLCRPLSPATRKRKPRP